jgi:Mycolic acid cyclopropane synthetase
MTMPAVVLTADGRIALRDRALPTPRPDQVLVEVDRRVRALQLRALRRDEANALQGEDVYNRYDRYLSGGAQLFHEGYLDIAQYTLEK